MDIDNSLLWEHVPNEFPSDMDNISDYFKNNQRKQWHVFPAGMGCLFFARHNGSIPDQSIMIFFMHSDDWIMPDVMFPKLVEFIPEDYVCSEDCVEMEKLINDHRHKIKTKQIKCPTCRVESMWRSSDPIVRFQLPEGTDVPKCILCDDNDITIMLNNCGHCTLCKTCALKL